MANIPFKSITFPGLPNKYTVPEISNDLMTAGKAADAKATGDALALKADKSTTYTKTEVDALIDEVEVETDTTLEVSGAPADAAETGRQIGLLKADLDASNTKLSLADGLALSYYTQIASGTDLNDITEVGNYYVTHASRASSLVNTPVTNAGYKLTVLELNNNRLMQIAYVNSSTGITSKIYKRNLDGNGWSGWVTLATKEYVDEVITSLSDEVSDLDAFKNAYEASNVLVDDSDGQLYKIPTTGNISFKRYVVEDGEIVEKDEGDAGTDYIKCPPYVVITFDNNEITARILMYFYTLEAGEYKPIWNLLNQTSSTNIKNYLSANNTKNRVIEVPDNTFMKISTAIDGDIRVFGWNGNHFGQSVCASGRDYTNGIRSSAVTGKTGLLIPGDVSMVITKKHIINSVWGIDENGNRTDISTTEKQSINLPKGYKYFYADISEGYMPISAITPNATKAVQFGNLDDSFVFVKSVNTENAFGRAESALARAKKISKIRWSAMSDALTVANGNSYFATNRVFEGVPYSSEWTKACYLGWHISAHTFVNAANDKRSVFYTEEGRHKGPGYGLVCSSYATLVCGFPYPVVNNGFGLDPKCYELVVNKPQLGMVMTKNKEHCLIVNSFESGNSYNAYTLYEQSTPVTRELVNYSFITNDSNSTKNYPYINDYIYAANHLDAIDGFNGTYDLDDITITGGSARPNRGDRSVYTSNDVIKINIKDLTASTCYMQECTYNKTSRVFTPVGNVTSMNIEASNKPNVIIDSGSLNDGAFYAVWTNTDDTKEYFEYHVLPTCTYSENNDTFTFDVPGGKFWYALWWQDDTPSGITEIVPYISNGDYTQYRKVYHPSGVSGYMFFKGVLGAYVAPLTYRA